MIRIPKKIASALYNRLTLRAQRGPIRIGLIGVGGWGASNAVSIMRSRRFTIAGVHDAQNSVAERFARRFKTRCFDTREELLSNPEIQAICITVPNHLHGEMVRACAEAGKAIFIEKPLASSADECGALAQCCEEHGVLLQVGHQMRREPVIRAMKHELESGAYGTPLYAHGVYTLERQQRDDWRKDARLCPGGSMEQLGIHLVDALVYLFGVPRHSSGWARNIPATEDGPDWGSVSMEFDDDVRATVSASFSSPRHLEMTVFCEHGELSTDGTVLRLMQNGIEKRPMRMPETPGSVAQFIAFADSIENGAISETGAAEAQAVMNVIESMGGGFRV